ncbi:hypothetical protein DAPPUDRAFT_274738 [Daphnia pulex]|uniref:Uncharacterized protein n=1 Tax=Daphnia pulex TaxID=6669 RepID=E9I4N3_DAPPU|nr:hypothetical protein DAPPUDRAFT_274738 [Daphnia pulex]|eukprot:EFX61047.1 hypothetical protein DAPPUDRAFT_274738 [Daphnia pulex]
MKHPNGYETTLSVYGESSAVKQCDRVMERSKKYCLSRYINNLVVNKYMTWLSGTINQVYPESNERDGDNGRERAGVVHNYDYRYSALNYNYGCQLPYSPCKDIALDPVKNSPPDPLKLVDDQARGVTHRQGHVAVTFQNCLVAATAQFPAPSRPLFTKKEGWLDVNKQVQQLRQREIDDQPNQQARQAAINAAIQEAEIILQVILAERE